MDARPKRLTGSSLTDYLASLGMFLASRYLLMHEDSFQHAETAVLNLQPDHVDLPLSPEDFHPGESLATYYGRKADAALRNVSQLEEDKRKLEEKHRKLEEEHRTTAEDKRKAEEDKRKAEEALGKSEENNRAMVARRRQRGHPDTEIAEDLGCTVEELLQRYPLPT